MMNYPAIEQSPIGNRAAGWQPAPHLNRLVAAFALGLLLATQSAAEQFDDLSRRAEAAIDDRPSEAALLYQQALALRPGWAEGWLYLGATLLRLGKLPEARDALQKGARLEPGKGTAWAYLGLAEYQLADYSQALSDIVKGESLGLPDRPDFVAAVRYRGALLFLRLSDPAQAMEQLRPLVRSGINSPVVIQALGISALSLKVDPAKVPADEQTLVDLAGHAAWDYLADRTVLCAPLFQQLTEQFPNQTSVHYLYGVFLLGRDQAAAEKEFRTELRLSPSHVLARVQLALLLSHGGDAAAAETFAGEAVQLEPSNALCQVTLGRVLLNAGRTKEALTFLEKGEQLAPDAARTHLYLTQAYKRAGRDADAQKQKAEYDRLRAMKEPASLLEPTTQ